MPIQILVNALIREIQHHPLASLFVWMGSILLSTLEVLEPVLQVVALIVGIVVAVITVLNRWQRYQIQKGERALQRKALRGLVGRVRDELAEKEGGKNELTEDGRRVLNDLKDELDVG